MKHFIAWRAQHSVRSGRTRALPVQDAARPAAQSSQRTVGLRLSVAGCLALAVVGCGGQTSVPATTPGAGSGPATSATWQPPASAQAENFDNPCFGRKFTPITEAVVCLKENGSPRAQLSSAWGDVDGDGEKEIIIRNVFVVRGGQQIEVRTGLADDDSLRGGCHMSLICHEAFPAAYYR